jgi:restriction system protein
MTVPDYQSLMLPVLKSALGGEARIGEVVDRLASELKLSEEDRAEMLPSGRQTTFANRVHWAKTYLKQAGLISSTRRAHFQITERGKSVLFEEPARIDVSYLSRFSEFKEFKERASADSTTAENDRDLPDSLKSTDRTPEEQMRVSHNQLNESLGQEILDRVRLSSPAFFERLVVSLLVAMGYGGTIAEAGRAIGKSGDDGVDGVIDQDPLGLDRVYIQAKRYQSQNNVGSAAIRDFFGSLDMHKASKGLFVATSGFSTAAMDTVEKLGKRIVLIDGRTLAQLMIRYNVACRSEETLEIKRLDEEFFE